MKENIADFGKSEVKEVNIDEYYDHISFVTGDKLEVTSYFPEDELPEVTFENGVLNITQDYPKSDLTLRIHTNDKQYSTKIVLPEGTIPENIDIQGHDVDIAMNAITGHNLSIDLDDSDITVVSSKFSDVTTKDGDGDISLDGEFGKVDVNTNDGELILKGKYEEINANTSEGDITVDTESEIDINKVRVHTGDGEMTVNGYKW